MARHARRIELSPECRHDLESAAWSESEPFRMVVRSRLIVMAAAGTTNEAIAEKLEIAPHMVCKWRRRFAAGPRLATLTSIRQITSTNRPTRQPVLGNQLPPHSGATMLHK